jgi:hypothetical protein
MGAVTMGFFTSLLTVAFVVLKLVGVISWSWFIVALPTILYLTLQIFLIVLLVVVAVIDKRKS